jgi:hypothetical protein
MWEVKRMSTARPIIPGVVLAEADPCGLWPDDRGPNCAEPDDPANEPHWTLGCATRRKIGDPGQ